MISGVGFPPTIDMCCPRVSFSVSLSGIILMSESGAFIWSTPGLVAVIFSQSTVVVSLFSKNNVVEFDFGPFLQSTRFDTSLELQAVRRTAAEKNAGSMLYLNSTQSVWQKII